MVHRYPSIMAAAICWAAVLGPAHADPQLVAIQTPRGVKQAFLLIRPAKPAASVILFAGGHGALGLTSASSMRWGARNFLVRSRDKFVAHNFAVAVIDAPSDRSRGMDRGFRMSSAHASDIAAVADYLKREIGAPVWLVGTSRGTLSAAAGAIMGRNIDGLVLTSTVTRSRPRGKIAQNRHDSVTDMSLSRIVVPTLIMAHRHDGCDVTPAADAPLLKQRLTNASRVEIVLLDGGAPPQSDPCEARSQHGFLGIEEKAVNAIAAFIKAATKSACKATVSGRVLKVAGDRGQNLSPVRYLWFSVSQLIESDGQTHAIDLQSFRLVNDRPTFPIEFSFDMDLQRECPKRAQIYVSGNNTEGFFFAPGLFGQSDLVFGSSTTIEVMAPKF